jgi:hypothetical protein
MSLCQSPQSYSLLRNWQVGVRSASMGKPRENKLWWKNLR